MDEKPEETKDPVADPTKEIDELREKLLRSAADYDNARKRLAKEREEFIRFSQERLLRDLIPILDNFERAVAHAETADKNVAAGIRLIWKQLTDALNAHGLKRFSSVGKHFDPHFHEAVDEVEENGPEGIVVEEIVPGYELHDRVLRPAKVRVRIKKGTKQNAAGEKEKEEELT